MTAQRKQLVYVSTYTHLEEGQPGRRESIYIFDFDSSSGKLDLRSIVHDVPNPSFFAISKDRRYLFGVNEVNEFSGVSSGGISAFAIDGETADLSFINAQSTHGLSPCYITLDASGKWALVTNYMGGNITVLPIGEGGRLGEATAVIQNKGHSVIPGRQDAPHTHSVIFDPSQRYVYVADLGLDQILIFRLDAPRGQLLPLDPPAFAAAPGAGPRHLEFHPNGRYLYVCNELDSTVSVYACAKDSGALTHQQTLSTLPNDFTGTNSVADIHITRSGQYLYVSNRGHDSIAVYTVDHDGGQLTFVEAVSSGGQTPRNFALDLDENYLLVANQDSHNFIPFQIDKNTGRLLQAAPAVTVPHPVCVKAIEAI